MAASSENCNQQKPFFKASWLKVSKIGESASRFLRRIERVDHIIQDKIDSLKQQTKRINKNGNNEVIPSNSILKLNDDCLFHIFSYLTIYERFKLSSLCERFEYVFVMTLNSTKSLDILNDLAKGPDKISLRNIRRFLNKYSGSIEHILFRNEQNYGVKYCHHIMTYIPKYCPNLKTLKLKEVNNVMKTTNIFITLKSINKLELIDCNIDDEVVFNLLQLSELTSLNLSHNYKLTGKHLDKFEKLQKLSLSNCKRIKHSNILEFCKSLKFLRELAVDVFNEEILNLMVNDMKNLENLMVSVMNICYIHKIGDIQNLKHLTLKIMCRCNDLTDLMKKLAKRNILETLCILYTFANIETLRLIKTIGNIKKIIIALKKVDNECLENCAECEFLQYLCIQWCFTFENSDFVNLIKKSKRLQTLHIPWGKYYPTDGIFKSLILDIVDVIKQENRSKRFKLIITGITMQEQTLLRELVPSNLSNIFELSFEEQDYTFL